METYRFPNQKHYNGKNPKMTQLTEPQYIERDPEVITREWINLYEEKSGKILQPAQIERLMIDVGAYRETLLRIEIQKTALSNLLNYAPLEVLKHLGILMGVEQLDAKKSTTVLKFSLDETLDFDCIIPAGTEVETRDGLFVFQTLNEAIIQEGATEITVNAECETACADANGYLVGQVNNLITPLSYISNVENITITSGGADEENVESLRERIRQAPEKFSNAGSKGAYRYHTFSAHPSITDVAIVSPSPGVVNVYPLTINGNPDSEIINIVRNYLTDEKIRPLTDNVQVLSPTKVDFEIAVEVTLFKDSDYSSVMAVLNEKLSEYKKNLSKKLGKNVIKTQIISLLNSTYGVYRVNILNPASDIDILENQWANLTNFSINFQGYADE